jgi:molybdopterin synthase catalytic subunit
MSNTPERTAGNGHQLADTHGVLHTAIVSAEIDVTELTKRVGDAGVGAVSVFLGTVRHHNDGRAVTGIDYEAYVPMAERELHAIAAEVCAEIAGIRIAIEHRIGTLVVGDVSVAIASAHARRAPALEATQVLIERLKVRVPIWKREHYVDGDRAWVDPTRRADAVPPALETT